MKNLKSRRGFSLVELMVVVAIMGTLAAIAIPAYNEYRKSAKKTAYRTDLLALHKGWLAFGVELDSFCERDTSPENATLGNVGMRSLENSKLYGHLQSAQTGVCAGTPLACTNSRRVGDTCAVNTDCDAPATAGPGKDNYIGFGATTCTNAPTSNVANISVRGGQGNTQTPLETRCTLGVSAYRMGAGGHLSGKDFIGMNVTHEGVVKEQAADVRADVFDATNANGLCAT